MENLTIGQIAKRTQLNVETIRYYERRGLILKPPRSDSGYRQYCHEAISRICFIKRAKKLGFSLKEISELLSLRVDPDTTCDMVKAQARIKVADIEYKIATLQKMKLALVKLTKLCQGAGPTSECPILDFLEAQEDNCESSAQKATGKTYAKFGKDMPIGKKDIRQIGDFRRTLSKALKVNPQTRQVCIQLYRQLACGKPVLLENVASLSNITVACTKKILEKWAISAIEYDEEGKVVAFGGLTLKPTPHILIIEEETLYTWCAFDTLFIPHILHKHALVKSRCPVSQDNISFTVTSGGIKECEPDTTFISLVTPKVSHLKGNVRGCFCCNIHFFSTEDTALSWLTGHDRAFIVSINEASELAQSIFGPIFKLN
ncbi:MAG: MerR family transcriptional regulator [Planctomycetes bacterium]|nr:MerR family transcriptional regulator [Planctomycetota bacterium]